MILHLYFLNGFFDCRDTDFVQATEKIDNRIIWAEMNIKLHKVFGPIMVSMKMD